MSKITIITGHYGSGKTTYAINLALSLKECGENVTVVDLDIINPFFRTSEYCEILHQNDIQTILPIHAGTTSDMPALSPKINAIFNENYMHYILDVGGDDVGATVLGQYSSRLNDVGYEMLYVVNKYRYMTQNVNEAVNILREIELTSRLTVTGVVNNSNLGVETTLDLVENSCNFVDEIALKVKLPVFKQVNIEMLKGVCSNGNR